MGELMTAAMWARSTGGVADVLRRGAWYAIVGETDPDGVLLDVRGKRLRFSRGDLTIRGSRPERWSIVVRTGVLRPTLGGDRGRELVTTYAVCPSCAFRQDLPDRPAKPPTLRCERCHEEREVDWGELC